MSGTLRADKTALIFDNARVTELVLDWQQSENPAIMARIVELSQYLVEAIVSIYDPNDREDLIQEALMKIQHSSRYFNPGVSTLHNYFTTVIHNICRTYSTKESRVILLDDFAKPSEDSDEVDSLEDGLEDCQSTLAFDKLCEDAILVDLTHYNRQRFPSIPCIILDEVSELIYSSLCREQRSRDAITQIAQLASIPVPIMTIIYNSSLIFLRNLHLSNASLDDYSDGGEFTLLRDLRTVLGEVDYKRVRAIFAGMMIKLPQ
jgi:hypothetical protein